MAMRVMTCQQINFGSKNKSSSVTTDEWQKIGYLKDVNSYC